MAHPKFNVRIYHLLLFLVLVVVAFDTRQSSAQKPIDEHIDNVLHGLRPPVAVKNRLAVRWTLAERMAALHVPGVSIAIIDGGRLIWAGGYGVRESGLSEPVSTSTLFQAQSISKPVSAMAMLRLVESGRLSLDQDVNTYLKSWKVPDNSFTSQAKVTLRRIVSHSAGITLSGFGGYRLGDPIPTLSQILNGEKPANNEAVRVDAIPGSISRYSGGGFIVMQQLLIDMGSESFPSLMERLVLKPAGMKLSTFEQPLPQSRRKEAASGHDSKGVVMKGKWPIQPEMAAAGLWTTPADLAKFAIEIANAWNGQPSKLLSKTMATEMLTTQKEEWGLGLVLKGSGQSFAFGHSGANLGFRAEFEMYPAVRKGAVIMTNADLGTYLIDEIFQSIAAEYNWPAHLQTEREAILLTDKQVADLVGTYTAAGPFGPVQFEVSQEGDRLFGELKDFAPKSEIFAATADSFFSIYGYGIEFTRESSGRAVKAKLGGQVEAVRK
jgi:CubicO group peptidase (beta-lactamase class C family)